MCRSMADIRSPAAEVRRGKKKNKEEGKKLQGKNIMAPLLHRAAIINAAGFSKPYAFCHPTNSVKALTGLQSTDSNQKKSPKLECGPMPNVMVALPNIGGVLCSTPQSLADAHYYMPCSNAAKMWKPLKVAGVPQTPETISAASGPKFTVLWAHVEEILLLNNFFSDCRYVP